MARPLRIEFAGALYHLMSRGNQRGRIVRDDADRKKRLDWIRRTIETYGWRLRAFVLMTNHDHLFVETPEPNLRRTIAKILGTRKQFPRPRFFRRINRIVPSWSLGREKQCYAAAAPSPGCSNWIW